MGIRSILRELPDSVTQAEMEAEVRGLCQDDAVDGLLVQLPLPAHLDEEAIIDVSTFYAHAYGFLRTASFIRQCLRSHSGSSRSSPNP